VVLLVFDEQGLDAPEQVPVPLIQEQLLAERHVVLDMLEEQGVGVPVQTAVEFQVQLLDERHMVLVVIEEQGVAVPEQTPEPAL
jgi:hypothetical protein